MSKIYLYKFKFAANGSRIRDLGKKFRFGPNYSRFVDCNHSNQQGVLVSMIFLNNLTYDWYLQTEISNGSVKIISMNNHKENVISKL